MGYSVFINDKSITKSKFCRPYKFLVHCVIHALGHRKGAYDEASDYIMNIISSLVLNRPYNISQVIFNHMLDNIKGEKYVQYPRFVQMLIDDQIPNLSKDASDELPLDHMDSETLKRLDVYRGVKPEDEPRYRQKFAEIKKSDYEALKDDKWRHDDSNSDDETDGMKLLVLKKRRWWFVKEEKRKRTPKVTTPKVVIKETKKKKSPPHLVDEPVIPPTEVINQGVDLLKMSFADYEKLSIAQGAQDVTKTTENVEAGGESLKEKFVEGEKSPKKKKASDEEDATYEPTPAEKEKIKKKGIRKCKVRPTGELPRRIKSRKDTTTVPEFEKVESVEVEITGVRIATPPSSPVHQSIPIPEVEREKTPEQPPKTVKEPSSASKKPPTPQSSSHSFPKVPYDLPSDFGDMFNDGKINALTRKVSLLEKAKVEAEEELKSAKEKLKDVESENVALRNEVEELSDVIEQLAEKIMEVNAQYKALYDSHKTLMDIVGDLHTSTSSENEVLKKEVEALRADKEIKDEQLNMLYTVTENKLGVSVQAVYDEIEIQRVEARRIEREKRLAEEAAEALKDKKKGLVIDTEEIMGSTSQPEPSQADEVNVSNAEENINDVEMKKQR
ncbi:hypothetical protein HanLR1_Chr05g0178611 [Helianthus annuus]|nr:hypothetical protein HanLR1_Chr05g0178611 [Helianthus annuus]